MIWPGPALSPLRVYTYARVQTSTLDSAALPGPSGPAGKIHWQFFVLCHSRAQGTLHPRHTYLIVQKWALFTVVTLLSSSLALVSWHQRQMAIARIRAIDMLSEISFAKTWCHCFLWQYDELYKFGFGNKVDCLFANITAAIS